jgi:DNA (cytosine-5)-methyltransferase 1
MTHGSLFSGIGGFDLAAEWMGWENIFHCEWNPFGQKVLKYYWPEAISYNDITKTDFTIHRGKIDVLTGGFPCQPYSLAGKRKGKEDERHLWPSMCRAIKEIQPRWIVGENVHGIVSWSGGLVFEEVQTDLEAQGYEVQSYVLPTAGVQNAPHRRDRVWFVAHAIMRTDRLSTKGRLDMERTILEGREWGEKADGFSIISPDGNAADTQCLRLQKWQPSTNISSEEGATHEKGCKSSIRIETTGSRYDKNRWQSFPTVSPVCNGNDGISDRLDGITFPKWREESIKAGGNAVCPPLVYQIFRTIQDYENLNT